jgi:hypothetical protein
VRVVFCKGLIQVPQVTVAARAERDNQVQLPPVELPVSSVFVDAPPVNMSNGEEIIYSDVTVTTSRVLCGGTTYDVRNITAAKMGETHPSAIPTLVAIVIGLCVLVTALARLELNAAVVFLFVVGVALIAVAVKHVQQLTPDYHLLISSSSGEVQACTSKDRTQVERIIAGVNEAIVRYR